MYVVKFEEVFVYMHAGMFVIKRKPLSIMVTLLEV